jgi:hypothetical protein
MRSTTPPRPPSGATTGEDLLRFFDAREVEIIAPGRGCVIKGREVVSRHVDMVLTVLAEAPESALCR